LLVKNFFGNAQTKGPANAKRSILPCGMASGGEVDLDFFR